MTSLHFPELDAHDLRTDPRGWLPDAEAIVDACDAAAAAGKPDGIDSILASEIIGAPALDMTVTAVSARAAMLAAEQGRAFFHHELRERIAMPEGQRPEIAVWDAGTVPIWNRGVLEEPKYFSFFLDTPFPAFNPNHRRKWRPHELLHGAMKFFWHPQMTRFEMYVGSRINELLPVVHWYGFDEIFRPRCERHRGKRLYQEYCAACEAAARPYWETSADWRAERRDEAIGWAERGLAHFEQEWQACQDEIRTGRVHRVEWEKLDASSDAIGYMRSHWNRMTAWSFGAWAETFLSDDVDYFSSLNRYMSHLAQTSRRLLGGEVAVEPGAYRTRRARRAIQDVAYRIYVAMDWLDEQSRALDEVEAHLMPALEQAAHHVHHVFDDENLAEYSDDVMLDLLQAFSHVRDCFPAEVARAIGALGYTWCEPERFARAGFDQVHAGVYDAMPSTVDALGDKLDDQIERFTLSAQFRAHGRLSQRFADWLASSNALQSPDEDENNAAELAAFEAWATRSPVEDYSAELFASMPTSFDEFAIRPGRVRLNKTLARKTFSAATATRITGDDTLAERGEVVELARIYMHGELRLLVIDPEAAEIFEVVESGKPRHDWVGEVDSEGLANLLENGFVIWLPEPF